MEINDFLKTINGLSEHTQLAYRQTLWQLHQVSKGDEPTDADIQKFLSKYKSTSLHRHKAAIKAYLEYQGRPWPFTKRQFRVSRLKIPRAIKPDKVEEIARQGNEDDYMFVITLFNLGCRISELMGITQDDITDSGVIITGKGGHHALIPVTKDFIAILKKYARKKGKNIFPEKYSFYYQRLKNLGEKAGVPELHPHILRHTRAVDLLNKKMELPYVQQFLRHANINTTARYLMITGGELGNVLEEVESGTT